MSSCSPTTGSSGSRSRTTSFWVLLSVVVPTSLGLALALILNMTFGGISFFPGVFYFPAILSLSIVGLIWSWMYHPTLGLLNQSCISLG